MFKSKVVIVASLLAVSVLQGCNAGMEPTGPTPGEIQAKMATLPPNEQISMIQHSPMSKPDKAKRIADIEAKYHLPATPVDTPAPGTPPPNPATTHP